MKGKIILIFYFNKVIQGLFLLINEYKFIDPDAPDNSISVNITKKIKYINEQQKKYTKKTFLLKNGINHIIEIEE